MSLGPEDIAVGFSLLDVLHVRLSEKNIKYAVKNHLFAGCDVKYDESKETQAAVLLHLSGGSHARIQSSRKDREAVQAAGVYRSGLQGAVGNALRPPP
jgi:hypothetical protein